MELKGKSVLVTGGAGFIGSHLVDRIIKEDPETVVVVDDMSLGCRDNLDHASAIFNLCIHEGDVCDKSYLRNVIDEHGIDVVFNLAVVPLPVSFTDPERCSKQNMMSVLNICELAREDTFETLIHFSSSEAYGDCIEAPMGEDHPLNAKTPYAASKIGGDKLVQSYITTYGIDATIVRPFNNFGPRQNYDEHAGVIPITVRRILEGDCPTIYGDGTQTRDFIYVKDTVEATVSLYKETDSRGQVVNMGSGVERKIGDLIYLIADYMDYSDNIIYEEERVADVVRHQADTTRAQNLIDFEYSENFEDNVRTTVDWFVQEMKPAQRSN